MVRWLVNTIFNSNIKNVMTGYRAFSKKFVKTISVMSPGFQIETELTIKALEYRYNVQSIEIQYKDRPTGFVSKLNTFSDGFKVLVTIFDIFKDLKPLLFFCSIALIFFIFGLIVGIPVINEYISTKYIYKIPSSILASSLMIISLLFIFLGLLLDHQANIEKRNHELYINSWLENNDSINIK